MGLDCIKISTMFSMAGTIALLLVAVRASPMLNGEDVPEDPVVESKVEVHSRFDTSQLRFPAMTNSSRAALREMCQRPSGDRPGVYCPDRRPKCCYDRSSYEYYCCPRDYDVCCEGNRSGCCYTGEGYQGEYLDEGGHYSHNGGYGGGGW